jgi:phosphoribosyl 1,2-cyclic phosphodiesterase
MQFAMLGSGSRGNATLVESGNTCLMIDCGFSATETEKRLARLSRSPTDVAAILVTHEHSDHIAGVARLSRKHDIPVWGTAGTLNSGRCEAPAELHIINGHDDFSIGDLRICPVPVPHDAAEPCQYVFDNGRHRLGVLTDTGEITPHIQHRYGALDALILECNHDPDMLARGRYSTSLKARVGGRLGHLNNHQAANLLHSVDLDRLQHLVAAHLSRDNNHPDLVLQALLQTMGRLPECLQLADQDAGLDWCFIS